MKMNSVTAVSARFVPACTDMHGKLIPDTVMAFVDLDMRLDATADLLDFPDWKLCCDLPTLGKNATLSEVRQAALVKIASDLREIATLIESTAQEERNKSD